MTPHARRPLQRQLASPLLICLFLPAGGLAQPEPTSPQPANDAGLIRRPDWERPLHAPPPPSPPPRWDIAVAVGPAFGPGFYPSGWPHGPRIAPPWTYPGLSGGPYVGYPWGFPGYSGRAGSFWSNGLSLYGPPVPVYGPIPGIFGNDDLVRQWRQVPSPGVPFGWVGIFAASPRPRRPSVSVWPIPGSNTYAPEASPSFPGNR